MSFLYEAMKNRCPSKRKIKPNEDNLMRMLSEMNSDSEEDEDYEVKPGNQEEESSDTISVASEKSNADVSPVDNVKVAAETATPKEKKIVRKRRRRRKKKNVSAYDQSFDVVPHGKPSKVNTKISVSASLEKCKAQLAQMQKHVESINLQEDICCVCLKADDTKKLSCQKCGLVIHNDCYGFPFTTISIVNTGENSKKTWFCDKCISTKGSNVHFGCEFCPAKFGLLKESLYGQWSHVICGKYILGKKIFYLNPEKPSFPSQNYKNLYINLESTNFKQFSSRDCILCDNNLLSKTGVCIKCEAGLCNVFFHVTCGQKFGLLVQSKNSNTSGIDTYAYCPLHCNKSDMKSMQEKYLSTEHMYQKSLGKFITNKMLVESLHILRMSVKNSKKGIVCSTNENVKPRLLSSNAYFSQSLNQKAKVMFGSYILNPNIQVPTPREIRKKHNVVPGVNTEYAAYYADRQLRIWESESDLKDQKIINKKLYEDENDSRKILENKSGTLIQLQSEGNEIKNKIHSIKNMVKSLKHWSSQPVSSKQFTKIVPQIHTSPNQPKKHTDEIRIVLPSLPVNHTESILKSCGICTGNTNQHLMAKCDVCMRWQHLACLDPPLRQMPKKNKYKMWQCSECGTNSNGESSSESVDTSLGSFIATDGRRLTTRSRKAPEKLFTKLMVEKHNTKMVETFGKKRKPGRPFGSKTKNRRSKKTRDALRSPRPVTVSDVAMNSSDDEISLMDLKKSCEKKIKIDCDETKKEDGVIMEIPETIKEKQLCVICNTLDESKKQSKCDTCNKLYHWTCCDPPIRFNPKPNKFHKWECTECVSTSSSSEEDVKTSRKRRSTMKYNIMDELINVDST